MINILHIIQSVSVGGAGREMLNVAKFSTDTDQFHHEIATLKPSPKSGLTLAKKLDVEVHDAPSRTKLYALMENVDIVHVHWWNNPEIVSFLSSAIPKSRLLIRYHVAGHKAPHNIIREYFDMADYNIVSFDELSILSYYDDVWKKTSFIKILHGTDFSRLPEEIHKTHKAFNVGYIGTVGFVKMHPDYVAISNQVDIPNVRFVVCGKVQEPALLQQVRKLHAENKFDFRGYTENIKDVIAEMDVFGYPLRSDTYASTELVLQEVMYAGVTPVVFPYGGLLQTVQDGFNGIVVNNAKEYKKAIEYLYNNPEERNRLGKNAREFVIKNLGIKNTVKQYISVYYNLMRQDKTIHQWNKECRLSVLEQPVFLQDITGEHTKKSASLLFAESLGEFGKEYKISMFSNEFQQKLAADRSIARASYLVFINGLLAYRRYDSKDPVLHFWAGLYFEDKKDFNQAIFEYKAAVNLGFPDWRVFWYLARSYKKVGMQNEYLKLFSQLKQKVPGFDMFVSEELGLDQFERKQNRGIGSPEKLYQTAQGFVESGREKEAIGTLKVFLSLYPDYAVVHNDLGVLYYNEGSKEKAFEHYELASQLEPNNLIFQKNLADFYYVELGHVEEAMQIYVKVLNANPEDVETLLIIGHICVTLEKFEDANDFYNRVLEIDAGNIDAIQNLDKLVSTRSSVIDISFKQGDQRGDINKTATHTEEYLVSAIVSAYNSEEFIAECLNNLVQQTISDKLEIIVVNGGSQQGEDKIVGKFQQAYDNIRYIKCNARETIYKSWNKAATVAKGKYLVNTNTDDRLKNDALEIMANTLYRMNDVGVVYIDQIITEYPNETFEAHHTNGFLKRTDFSKDIIVQRNPCGPQVMWRKKLHELIGYFKAEYEVAGDWDFWLRVVFNTDFTIHHISELLGLYYYNRQGLEHGGGKQKERLREIDEIRKTYGNLLMLNTGRIAENQQIRSLNKDKRDASCKLVLKETGRKGKSILLTTSAAPSQSPFSTTEKRPPIGIGFLISVLRDAGHNVFFIDNYLQSSNFLETDYLQKNAIDYVGIYANTICYRDTLRMLYKLEWLRQTGRWQGKIIVGGPHATVCLDTIPDFVDYVVQGEGEQAILDIVEGRVAERVVKYPRIKNLDELPMPAWDYFVNLPYNWGGEWFSEKPVFTMNTSRGCPFRCTFCSVGSIWGKEYTYFSAERIVSDIEYLIERYGAKGIYFREDNFTLNKKRLKSFCNLLLKKGIEISWACETRVNSLDKEIVELMSRAGVCGFYFGVESGSQRVLDFIQKDITVEQTRNAFKLCHEFGIKMAASVVVGVPTETEAELKQTTTLLKEIKPTVTWFNVFVGIPNSELYKYTIKNKLYEFIDDRGLVYLKEHNERVKKFYGGTWDADIPVSLHQNRLTNPKISVVMSVYNGEKHLKAAIESVLRQTYQDYEFIIVDDASNDKTNEILESFDDPRIQVINNSENQGLTQSLNRGITAAKGKYIARMDADDISLPHRFEIQVEFLERNPDCAVAGSSYYQIDDRGKTCSFIEVLTDDSDIKEGLKTQNWFGHGSVMMLKDAFLRAGGYNEKYKFAQDYDLWLRMAAEYRLANIKEPLYCWRVSSSSISKQKSSEQRHYANLAISEAQQKEAEKMDVPLVSVIVPTYNRPEMLAEAINSIRSQTYNNFEIVVVNDAGMSIENVVLKLNKDKNITCVVHAENRGLAAARNTGIKIARGKYIALLDDDDLFYPDHLETAMQYIGDDSPVIYTNAVRAVYEKAGDSYSLVGKRVPYSIDFSRDKLLIGNISPVNCFVFEKKPAIDAGLFDATLTTLEDWEFWIRLSSLCRFKHIPRETVQVNWRTDGTTMTSSRGPEFKKNRDRIYKRYQEEINKIADRDAIVNEFKQIWEQDEKQTQPLVSIVILAHNQLEYTKKCIESVIKHTKVPFELVFVDNASTDGTIEYLESEVGSQKSEVGERTDGWMNGGLDGRDEGRAEEWSEVGGRKSWGRIKIIKNKENLGFAKGNNQGIAASIGKYILLLNNDVVVTQGWLSRMVACAEKSHKIGIVGPKTNCISGREQLVDNVFYDTNNLSGLERFSSEFAGTHSGRATPFWRVVGFCMLIKRAVIDKIGGLDVRYGLGNFEDDDFSLRAALAGFESRIAEDCFIHHYGSRTFIGDRIDCQEILTKNWGIFKRKWGLPHELPYGSPFNIPRISKEGFVREKHFCPLDQGYYRETGQKDVSSLLPDAGSLKEVYQKVQRLVDDGRQEEAIGGLERLLKMHPDFAIAHNDLGVLYYERGDKDKALKHYKQAAELNPDNSTFQKNLADFYYVELGRVEDALRIYVKVLAANPEDVEVLLVTGHISVSLSKFDDAKLFYSRALEIEPLNEDARQNLYRLENIEQADNIVKSPEDIYQDVLRLVDDGRQEEAISGLERLLEMHPDFAIAHNDLGVLYYESGDKDKALKHYKLAAELNPDNITFQKNLADFYYVELGRVEDALLIYVKVLAANPEDVEVLLVTGHISVSLCKFDDAKLFYSRALEIEPLNEDARQNLHSLENIEQADQIVKSPEDIYQDVLRLVDDGRQEEAIGGLERLLEMHPDFAIAHNDLGVLYYERGDKDKALKHYKQAAELNPDNITFQKNLADFYYVELGRVEDALRIYVKVLEANPEDVEVLLVIGHISVSLCKFDDAKIFYSRALEIEPWNEDARQNLRILADNEKKDTIDVCSYRAAEAKPEYRDWSSS